jgi:hypothetical protein
MYTAFIMCVNMTLNKFKCRPSKFMLQIMELIDKYVSSKINLYTDIWSSQIAVLNLFLRNMFIPCHV